MPLQTRSRSRSPAAAPAMSEGPTEDTSISGGANAEAMVESSSASPAVATLDREMADGSIASRERVSTPSSSRRSTYASRDSEMDSSSRHENLLSSPSFNMSERVAQRPRDPPPTMDQGESRDFDRLDLDEEIEGDNFFAPSPPRTEERPLQPEDMDISDRKPRASSLKRTPSYHAHHHYPPSSRGGGAGYRATPSSAPRHEPSPYYNARYPPHSSPPAGYHHPEPSPRERDPYAGYSPYHRQWDGGSPFFQSDYTEGIPPPSSSKKRQMSPSRQETPEKLRPKNPFRSPPPSAKQKFRKSPIFPQSPHIGNYGSFGMETPSGTLPAADFSPMEPTLYEFASDGPDPFPDIGPSFSRSPSREDETDSPRRVPRPGMDASPLSGFMPGMSPFENMHDVNRSPLRSTGYVAPPHRPGLPTSASRDGDESGRRMPHHAETPRGYAPEPRRNLWPTSDSATPGRGSQNRFRVEIGSSGPSRKSLEGINTMMHGSASKPRDRSSRYEEPPSSSRPRGSPHYGHPPPLPHSYPPGYGMDTTTPIKSGHSSYAGRRSPPSGHRHPYHQQMPMGTPGYAGSRHPYHPSMPNPSPPGMYPTPPVSRIPSSTGKENSTPSKKMASKGMAPCNCKKSKCLKLYCDCFQAMRFCSGCNCSDCGNTPSASQQAREKAIKDAKAKNPAAFKPQSVHKMGCKCKKTECLKKYCECFQEGIVCSEKCKCQGCQNFAGSQALIDRRNKIKDRRGAELAMRLADKTWRGRGAGMRGPPDTVGSGQPRRSSSPSASRMPPPPHMMHPSPRGPPPGHRYGMGPYMGPPPGYHSVGVPITPGYPPHHPPMQGDSHHGRYHHPPPSSSYSRKTKTPKTSTLTQSGVPKVTPPTGASTPRKSGVRLQFDPASSRKKRELSPGDPEPTFPYFGEKFPDQPKTAALAIFSFLSNDDIYNAGLVCKSWSRLAMDDEIWQFQTPA